jgi:hypothetical protein
MQSHQVDFGRIYVVLQPINYQQIKKKYFCCNYVDVFCRLTALIIFTNKDNRGKKINTTAEGKA